MDELIDRLERRQDDRAAAELARVLKAAQEDVSAGWGDDRGH